MEVQTLAGRDWSYEEKREHVLAYLSCEHGQKAEYLRMHQIPKDRIASWKAALADGDLSSGRYPRHTGGMAKTDVMEIRRLQDELKRKDEEINHLQEELDTSRSVVDVLGKAIDALSNHGVASDKEEQA